LNQSIRKLQEERHNQNIEQQIRDINEKIVEKMAELEGLHNELQLDVNQK